MKLLVICLSLLSFVACSPSKEQRALNNQDIAGLWQGSYAEAEIYMQLKEDGGYEQLIYIPEHEVFHRSTGNYYLEPDTDIITMVISYDSCRQDSAYATRFKLSKPSSDELQTVHGSAISKFSKAKSSLIPIATTAEEACLMLKYYQEHESQNSFQFEKLSSRKEKNLKNDASGAISL